jgi:transcriptional regulator with GAF, ATPase, and Fis domain
MPIEQDFEDLHIVRRVRQIVRKWWSIELAFADDTGFVVDHKKGIVVPPHNPICQTCLRGKEGFSRCNRSVEKAIVQLARKPDSAQRAGPCHMGLDIVAVPVVVDGEYQGAMFACGFVIDEGSESGRRSTVIDRARALGLERDVPDLEAAYDSIARLDSRDLEYFKDLLATTAAEVSEFASTVRAKEQRIQELSAELQGRHRFGSIIGKSDAMKRLFSILERVVDSDATVLITGENGTGKELIARAVHYNGNRREQAFVAQNCSALNDNLLESELFGHVKGSFTGATRDKQGLFKVADGGTFFLDEVGDMSPSMQVKVLRVLQDGTFLPVGATKPEKVDVRIIAATNRPLKEMVAKREFREDLYYRLNVINIEVPPLRERLEDLPVLCDHFLNRLAERTNRPLKRLAPEVMADFYAARWSGNIRELENTIERLVVLAGENEVITGELRRLGGRPTPDDGVKAFARFKDRGDLASAVQALEREMIEAGLIATHWNKSRLAEKLGLSRTTLIKKIKDFGLEDRET